MRHAVVTGATGPLGLALVSYLRDLQISTTAVVRPGSPRIAHLPSSEHIRVVSCDLAELGQLRAQLPPAETFFHLGWSATDSRETRDDPAAHARNIVYTLDAVELARAVGCATFVGVGSQSELACIETVDGCAAREESYGVAKYAAGRLSLKLCRRYAMRHCWARLFSIYGPGERETTALMYCIRELLEGHRPELTRGEQLWDYLYARDCARAVYLIAERGRDGASYDVGSGRVRPLREYFECTRDSIDPALPLGLGEREYPKGQPMRLCADICALTEATGFVPEYSFEQGICETIAWVRQTTGR
jgi:UDP-glucose 4-epimerase